jgi:LmbE family N-acetylglucosaminyl deacetylase
MDYKNILVLAPHTDDGELGVGGTISRFLRQGATITYAAFSTAEESVQDGLPKDILKREVAEATKRLGIKSNNLIIYNYPVRKLNFHRQEILEHLIDLRKNNYDLIFIPSLSDVHQDHSTISTEAVRAFKNTTILGYELIWNNLSFNTTCFISLEKQDVENKIHALNAYKSQHHRPYMSRDFIFSQAQVRGVQSGQIYAEVFEVIRWMI